MNLATMISLVMLPVLLNLSSGCKPRNPSSGLQGTRVPYAAQQFQNMGVIHIVETDLLLDDLAALEVMAATIMKESKGQNVIIITADDETKLKAGAAYQYLSMFGKDQVIVIPGPVVASLHPFDYLETYRDDKHKKYLETLAGTEYASHINPTNSYDLFEAIKQSKARVRVYSLANPIGINTYVMGTLKDQIDTVYSMGMYRVSGTNATSGYNANINLEEQLKFLQSVQSNNIEVIHLPSSLFYQKEDKIIENTANARKKMRLPNNPTIQKLDKSLLDFQNLFAGESIRKLGVKDPWAMLFDAKQAWPQDLYTFASSLLLREELTLQKVKIELPVPGNYNPKNLGIAVTRSTVVNDDPGRFYEVTTLNLPALTKKLLEAYNGGTAAMPVRNPESYFQKSENVALLITKASIDDMALVRTLITKRQLGLVYTESVDAGNSAEIFQKILTAYGAKVPVIGGSGAMKSGITNLKAEEYLFATGYGKQILGRKAAADHSDASNPKNAAEIAKFINNASKKVDIFITTSVTDFNEALKQVSNPQQRIGVVHIMGGARGDGNLTRNWLLNPMATQNVLQTLNQARIPTYIYSSGILGGSVAEVRYPDTIKALKVLVANHGIEKGLDNMRLQWNKAVAKTLALKNFDAEGNYGSPLSYMIALGAAIGTNLNDIVKGTPVKTTIDAAANKVIFENDTNSSIILLSKFESYEKIVLDKCMAKIYDDADKWLKSKPKSAGDENIQINVQ